MNIELKHQIVQGAIEYAKNNGINQNDVSKYSGVNAGYISKMWNGDFETIVNNKPTPIGDKWFYELADWCGFPIRKTYWSTIETIQFKQMISALESAKKTAKTSVLINETGLGKSYAVDRFVKINPVHTYRITVSSVHKLPDILREICQKLNVHYGSSNAYRLKAIIEKMIDLRHAGNRPCIIIDEAENLEFPVLKMLKGLYDGINMKASIILIGTDQLTYKLQNLRRRNKDGMPQFYRRIKAGIKVISPNKDFTPFFEKFNVEKPLRKLLTELCDNYGELNDYLEPALKEADDLGQPLTEQLFRVIYDMPKFN